MIRLMFFLILSFFAVFSVPVPESLAGSQSRQDLTKAGRSLFSAIENTLVKNPRILAEKERIGAYQASLMAEKKQWYPGISLEGAAQGNDDSKAYVSVQQPLWMGGRIGNAIEKAEIQLAMSRKVLLRVQRDLMEETVVAYANVTGLDLQIRSARKNIDEHQRFLGQISRRKKGQISSEADVQLTRSRYSQAVLTQQELLGRRQLALNDLFSLTRTPMEHFEAVPPELLILPGHAEVEAEVAGASPRIDQALLGIKSADLDRRINRSQYFPSVYGRLDQDIYDKEGTSYQHRDTTLSLVVQGALDGAGFRTLDQVRAADALIRTAQLSSDGEKNDIRHSARNLLFNRDTVRELVTLNTSLVRSTEQTLASYTRQFEAGRKSWLDLLNIQREHANARLALELVKSQYQQVCLRLAVQMGRLDKICGIRP